MQVSQDGTTEYTNVVKPESELNDDDITANNFNIISSASEAAADNANGAIAATQPPITGYVGR